MLFCMKMGIILAAVILLFAIVGVTTTPRALFTTPVSSTSTASQISSSRTRRKSCQPVSVSKRTMTTLFWVGEGADSENAYISNQGSYWDDTWTTHFGGVDDPNDRCSYYPCAFVPKENPFYVALPYGEFESGSGDINRSAKTIPWYKKHLTTATIHY
jgi:hypothetical protein